MSEIVELLCGLVVVAKLHVGDCLQGLAYHLGELIGGLRRRTREELEGRQVLVALVVGKPSQQVRLIAHCLNYKLLSSELPTSQIFSKKHCPLIVTGWISC